MKNLMIISLVWITSLGLFIMAGCAPKEAPIPVVPVAPEGAVEPVKEKVGWEAEWEKTLAKAREEGKIVIGTDRVESVRQGLSNIFKEKYGLEIEWLTGRGVIIPKIIAEKRAGLYLTDLFLTGDTSSITLRDKVGLQPMREAFILPEVKDEKAWYEGRFPFIDKEEKYVFVTALYPNQSVSVNTELVPNYKEELASYYDLLDPKWKGKIISVDMLNPGSGLKWFGAMIEGDFGPILGLDYMRALAKQNMIISTNERLVAEWLVRGKYPVAMPANIDTTLLDWKREGIKVPVVSFPPKEGSYMSTGGLDYTFFDKAPHPNAAVVFLNWILSREGQTLQSKLSVKHSTRIDIPNPQEIDPLIIAREPKLKYPRSSDEKYLDKMLDEYPKLAKEVFGHLYTR